MEALLSWLGPRMLTAVVLTFDLRAILLIFCLSSTFALVITILAYRARRLRTQDSPGRGTDLAFALAVYLCLLLGLSSLLFCTWRFFAPDPAGEVEIISNR